VLARPVLRTRRQVAQRLEVAVRVGFGEPEVLLRLVPQLFFEQRWEYDRANPSRRQPADAVDGAG